MAVQTDAPAAGKWRMILLLSLAEFLAMVVWFSASSVMPSLNSILGLDVDGYAWMTNAVQIGFVFGAFGSSLLTLADRIPARILFTVSAFAAAACTVAIPFLVEWATAVLLARLFTGMFLAGVYPVGMKIMATWTVKDRGLGIGLLVGALTVGSAFPQLINALGGVDDWRAVMWVAGALAALGGVIALLFVREGPYKSAAPRFRFGDIRHVIGNRRVMLANAGYLGHMWELYAMWTWLVLFLSSSFAAYDLAPQVAYLVTFCAIAAGGIGSVIAGRWADRVGRANVTVISMGVSGLCALLIGQLHGAAPALVAAVAIIWGLFIVADSAQFSASVTELVNPRYTGTALTLQTSMGFLLTLVSIRLIPGAVAAIGWQWAFALLAIGPVMGIVAMLRLKSLLAAGAVEYATVK